MPTQVDHEASIQSIMFVGHRIIPGIMLRLARTYYSKYYASILGTSLFTVIHSVLIMRRTGPSLQTLLPATPPCTHDPVQRVSRKGTSQLHLHLLFIRL